MTRLAQFLAILAILAAISAFAFLVLSWGGL